MTFARAIASALLATLLASSTGCTVAGVALGSRIPRCPTEKGPVDLATLPIGTDVEVAYVTNPTDEWGSGSRLAKVEGVYRGADWSRVYVESDEKSYGIPFSRVRETHTLEGSRSYALEGLYVGITLDVAFLTFLWLSNVTLKPAPID